MTTRSLLMPLLCALIFSPAAALADYQYLHPESEYAMILPEAPTVETIWGGSDTVPYLEGLSLAYGIAGEYGLLKQTDPRTGEFFEVRTTFVKAPREFLQGLTEDKIRTTLTRMFSDVRLEKAKFSYSQGADTLKWGTYSGFSLSKANEVIYNVAHYLVGTVSVMTVKIGYSVENPSFSAAYKTLSGSLKHIGK